MNAYEFTVTRQRQWATGDSVVEINQGDINYANADMLVVKYRKLGESETFKGMTPAVKAAIEIAKAWQKDEPNKQILIAVGYTHGMSMPFEGEELTPEVEAGLLEKAEEFDEKLERCDQCGEPLGKEKWGNAEFGEYNCCSEYCAGKYWEEIWAADHEEEDAETEY